MITYTDLIWKLHDAGMGDAPHTMRNLTVKECFSDADEQAKWDDESDEKSIKSVEDEIRDAEDSLLLTAHK